MKVTGIDQKYKIGEKLGMTFSNQVYEIVSYSPDDHMYKLVSIEGTINMNDDGIDQLIKLGHMKLHKPL